MAGRGDGVHGSNSLWDGVLPRGDSLPVSSGCQGAGPGEAQPAFGPRKGRVRQSPAAAIVHEAILGLFSATQPAYVCL